MTSTLVAVIVPAAPTAIDLVRRARALKQAYQQTWCLEDLEARICCYLRAIDLLYKPRKGDSPLYVSVSHAPKNSVAGELLAKEEGGRHACAIGTWRRFTTDGHFPNTSLSNRDPSVGNRI